jgi:shikimate dehydrogenase
VSAPPRSGATHPPTRLVLLGHPLGHTLSPALHGAALASAGRPIRYDAVDVTPERLDRTLDALFAEHAAGNVTLPHKPAVAARCARRSADAERAGAVNTFWREANALVGHNTDVGGFDTSARALLDDEVDGLAIAVIGAGGAAGGVLTALERWPRPAVRVWSRTRDRADALAARFGVQSAATLDEALADASLVVNATPMGLRDDDPHPIEPDRLPPTAAVLDLVYRRGETRWVHAARALGHRAADGLHMLVEQAALAEECWFGGVADREAMWQAVGGRPAWLAASRRSDRVA